MPHATIHFFSADDLFGRSALFLRSFQQQRPAVSYHRRKQHKQSVFGVPGHIKIIAGNQQPNMADFFGKQIITQNNGRKEKNKFYGIKQHCEKPPQNFPNNTICDFRQTDRAMTGILFLPYYIILSVKMQIKRIFSFL